MELAFIPMEEMLKLNEDLIRKVSIQLLILLKFGSFETERSVI